MRKVRRSHTKSRKGCLQCKNGHVKVSVAVFFSLVEPNGIVVYSGALKVCMFIPCTYVLGCVDY